MRRPETTHPRKAKRFAFPVVGACLALTVAACGTGNSGSDSASEYPSKRVSIVVPYSAGGPSDLTMRALAEFMQKETGETFVVENRDGASGAVAMRYAMQQPADGYTLFNIGQGANIITPILEDVDYDRNSMVPVANVAAFPSALVVGKNSEAQTGEELFDMARADPESISVSTAGATTPGQIAVEQLATGANGVPFQPVPFPGNAEALTALLGENVDALQINITDDILARAEKGDIRILGVGTPERLEYLEDVPTFAELGFEEAIYSTSPYFVGVKEGTDQAIRDELADLMNKATHDDKFRETVGELFVTEGDETPEELTAFINDTYEAYLPILGDS